VTPSADLALRALELFRAALELDAGERDAFLAAGCGDDAELRAEVDALVRADAAERSPLDGGLPGPGPWDGATAEAWRGNGPGEPDAPLHLPERIGGFRITGLIGRGGMGLVYAAEQDAPRRRVALKVVHPSLLSTDARRRFRREAELLGRLQHPGIAQIHAAGEDDLGSGPQPYFVMERVDGVPLLEFATSRALDVRARVELVRLVCAAVHYAHERGIVHRDLKPENVLVQADGTPKVLDFGVARAQDAEQALTTFRTDAQRVIGTLEYMSPEQAAGSSSLLDARSDVFALGVVLFQLLSGELPHDLAGRSLPAALQVVQEVEPRRLGSVDARLRGELETIVGKALAREPRLRYPTARALADDLGRYLRDEPIRARPTSAIYQLRKLARRHKSLFAGVAVAFLALVVALVVSIDRTRRAVVAEERARRESSRAAVIGAGAALEATDPLLAVELLEGVPEEHRAWEWHFLASRVDASLGSLDVGGDVLALHLDPAGEVLTTVTASGRLVRRVLDGGREVESRPLGVADLAPGSAPTLRAAAVSADGGTLVATLGTEEPRLVAWRLDDPASGRALALDARPGHTLAVDPTGCWAAWIADNRLRWCDLASGALRTSRARGAYLSARSCCALSADAVAVGSQNGVIELQRLTGASDEPIVVRTASRAPVLGLAFSPDGTRLAAAAGDGVVHLLDAGTGAELQRWQGQGGTRHAVAFSPDGAWVLSTTEDRALRVRDARTGADVATLHAASRPIRSFATAAGTTRFATFSEDGVVDRWDVARQLAARVLRAHESFVYAVDHARDGSLFLSAGWDRKLLVWEPGATRPRLTIPLRGRAYDAAFSPDGARIAATGGGKGIDLFAAATGDLLATVQGVPARGRVCWSPDGRRLLLVSELSDGVDVVDAASATVLRRLGFEDRGTTACAASPDGALFAVGHGDGSITLWDAERLVLRRRLDGHRERVHDLAFDSAGRRLASGSRDCTARVWDAVRGDELFALDAQSSPVWSVAFSPDDRRVVTGSDDGLVRVFDAADGALVARLRGHEEYVYAASFSPDGTRLTSGSGDGTVRVWDAVPLRERLDRRGTARSR